MWWLSRIYIYCCFIYFNCTYVHIVFVRCRFSLVSSNFRLWFLLFLLD